MNDLQRHKSLDKIKWIITFTNIFLIVVLIIGMCLQLFGTGNQKPSNWFNDNKDKEITTEMGVDLQNEGLIVSIESNPSLSLSCVKVSEAGEASDTGIGVEYLLTATVLPDTCFDKQVNFTLDWVNPDAAWVMDGNKSPSSYVNLVDTGSVNSVKLVSVAPFSEKIKVIATSLNNSSVSSYCILGFNKRLDSLSFRVLGGSSVSDPAFNDSMISKLSFSKSYHYCYDANFTDGTKSGTLYFVNITVMLNMEFRKKLCEVLTQLTSLNINEASDLIPLYVKSGFIPSRLEVEDDISNPVDFNLGSWNMLIDSNNSSYVNAFGNALFEVLSNDDFNYHALITCSYSYNIDSFETPLEGVSVFYLKFDPESISENASSIILDKESIDF